MTHTPDARSDDAGAPVLAVDLTVASTAPVTVWSDIVAMTGRWAREPGCLGVTVLQSQHDPARLLVLESFESTAALQAHQQQAATQQDAARIQQSLTNPPIVTLWAQVPPPSATPSGARTPEEINRLWADAVNAGNADALLDLYEDGATLVVAPHAPAVTGRAAIGKALGHLLSGGIQVTFRPRYWVLSGDLALGSIHYQMHAQDPVPPSGMNLQGTTCQVARRQPDGSWKYVIDHPYSHLE